MMSGQDTSKVKSTNGFEIKAVQFERFILNIKEIGGKHKKCIRNTLTCDHSCAMSNRK